MSKRRFVASYAILVFIFSLSACRTSDGMNTPKDRHRDVQQVYFYEHDYLLPPSKANIVSSPPSLVIADTATTESSTSEKILETDIHDPMVEEDPLKIGRGEGGDTLESTKKPRDAILSMHTVSIVDRNVSPENLSANTLHDASVVLHNQDARQNNYNDQIEALDRRIQTLQQEHDGMISAMNQEILQIKENFNVDTLTSVPAEQLMKDQHLAEFYFSKVAETEQSKTEQVNQVIDTYMQTERNPKVIQEEIQSTLEALEALRSQGVGQ